MRKTSTRSRNTALRQHEIEETIERIASDQIAALEEVVDFSAIQGAPEWVVRLILPDAQPLLAKPPSRWKREEIARLQESVDTLTRRLRLAMRARPTII